MSHSPPVPEANQSPYPLQEPKHDRPDLPPVLKVADQPAAAPALPIGTIGAVIGLGAVAIGGAILGLRLWGAKAKPKPKRKGRRKQHG
ncbi:hypothetical protein ACFSC3_09225 [Sphingomonas floccifaciens]|uniref:Uncharacterized protein n=1 Tax=Sphingomonas floccifaciens TaxID=1844115 RepID=A0ABW4NDX6_9SPHN